MAHPSRARNWISAESDSTFRYYDFREHPELIPQVLEDFRPFAQWPAIQEFYGMLADINGLSSSFESNDSAFTGPAALQSHEVSAKKLEVSGRIMVLFHELPLNRHLQNLQWLEQRIHSHAAELSPELEDGVIGTSVMRMHLPELGSDAEPVAGYQLAVHFWAWGDTDDEVFANLDVVVHNMRKTISLVSADARRQLL